MIFVLFTPKGIQSGIDRRTMAIEKWEEEKEVGGIGEMKKY